MAEFDGAHKRCFTYANPSFPYTKGAIKTMPLNSLIFPKNINVLENISTTERL